MIILLPVRIVSIVKGTQKALFLFLQWSNEGQTGSVDMGKLVNLSAS